MAKRLPFVLARARRDGTFSYRGYADTPGGRVFSRTYDLEHDAYLAALRMRNEVAAGPAGETLDEACERLIEEARAKRTKGTVRWYQDHLRAVRSLIPGETVLVTITSAQIEEFVRERLRGGRGTKRKCGPATVNADLRALHRVFSLAIRRGAAKINPVVHVDRPRQDHPPIDWFTEGELREILAQIPDQRTRDVLLVFALTGVRRAEASRLTPAHVRLRLGQLVIPGKVGTRIVPLSPDLHAPLERLLAAATDGHLIGTTHQIDDLFRAAKAVVKDRRLHPHALRHTFGTALVRSGVRPDVVMRLLGHRQISTTLRYVHEVGQDGVQAVGLLRLVDRDPPAGSAQAGPR